MSSFGFSSKAIQKKHQQRESGSRSSTVPNGVPDRDQFSVMHTEKGSTNPPQSDRFWPTGRMDGSGLQRFGHAFHRGAVRLAPKGWWDPELMGKGALMVDVDFGVPLKPSKSGFIMVSRKKGHTHILKIKFPLPKLPPGATCGRYHPQPLYGVYGGYMVHTIPCFPWGEGWRDLSARPMGDRPRMDAPPTFRPDLSYSIREANAKPALTWRNPALGEFATHPKPLESRHTEKRRQTYGHPRAGKLFREPQNGLKALKKGVVGEQP